MPAAALTKLAQIGAVCDGVTRIALLRRRTPGDRQVATLRAGQCFGEMALVGAKKKRNASIRAQGATPTTCAVLSRSVLHALLQRPEYQGVALKIGAITRERQASNTLFVKRDGVTA